MPDDQPGKKKDYKPYPVRPAHRPSLLDDDIHDAIVKATAAGATVVMAAEHAGVSDRVVRLWMQKGAQALWDLEENGIEPDGDTEKYLRLYNAVVQARARRAVADVALVHRSAEGGAVIEETERTWRDPDTREVVKEKTVKKSPPDWRAAAWYLERQYRRHGFGREDTIEVSGPDGGPVRVESSVGELAERLAATIAGRAAARQLTEGEGGEVVDAEVVDDG